MGSSVDADHVFQDWQQDADGIWTRQAARVIAVAGGTRVLLLRGFDVEDPARTWWFTPGGGVEPGESLRDAAVRELLEESGIRTATADLIGPVAARSASFPYFGRSCRQDEVLYFARINDDDGRVNTDGWTAVERASVSEVRWWDLDQLATTTETVYPPALPGLVRTLVADGWDGAARTID